MQILVENGYVTSYALIGNIVGGIVVDDPEDPDLFEQRFTAYRLVDGVLEFDEEKYSIDQNLLRLDELRMQRDKICFPIINRGALWYEKLTEEQKDELSVWYQAWLDVTESGQIPVTPEWVI